MPKWLQKFKPSVSVMKSAEDRYRDDTANHFGVPEVRSVLLQKQVCSYLVVRAPGEAWERRKRGSETFHWDPVGIESHPERAGQPTGSESCVAVEQSTLRSVDSECAGRVIEPRNMAFAGVDAVYKAQDNTEAR